MRPKPYLTRPTSTIVFLKIMYFFSSRRRHTRFDCDWSSDVCSSDLDHAQTTSYILNGRALQWTSCSTRTCRECGSIHHLVRSCKEANKKHNIIANNDFYAPIYKRFKVKPNYPKGFLANTKDSLGGYVPDESNWGNFGRYEDTTDWEEPDNVPKRRNFSYADVTKSNTNKGPSSPPKYGRDRFNRLP